MSAPPAKKPEIDPETVQDLRLVDSARRMFGACGERIETWEAYMVVKADRAEVQAEIDRVQGWVQTGMRAKLCDPLKERLAAIRAEFGTLGGRLTEYLLAHGTPPLDPMTLDLAAVFILGTEKGRESAARWTADPAAASKDANLKLQILAGLVKACTKALDEPPAAAPSGDTALRRPGSASIRLKGPAIEALRVLNRSRVILQEGGVAGGWELFYLALARSDELRGLLGELEQLRKGGKPGEFAGETQRIRGLLKEVAAAHEDMIPPLREYLAGAFGSFNSDRDDLALALLAGAPQGRHFAKQWLEDPVVCQNAAIASMTAMRARASAYLESARKSPSGAVA